VNSLAQPDYVGAVRRALMCGELNRMNAICSVYDETPSTANNRTWSFGTIFGGANNIDYPVDPVNAASNTTTRTYLTDLTGISIGTWLSRNGSLQAANHCSVTAIGANYIDHTSVTALTSGQVMRRTVIQSLTIVNTSDQTVTDVTLAMLQTINGADFAFATTLEATASLTDDLTPDKYIVYGDLQKSLGSVNFPSTGSPLGVRNSATGAYDSPVQAVYEILYYAGFYDNEAYYDTDSFEDAAAACDITLAISTPRENNHFAAESYRELLARICEAALLKVYMKSGRWRIDLVAPLGSATHSLTSEDVSPDIGYRRVTEEITRLVTVKYDFGEVTQITNNLTRDSYRTVTADNVIVEALNNNYKTLVKDLPVSDETTAETLANRYSFIFSEPLGFLTVKASLAYIDVNLGDIVEIDPSEFEGLPFTDTKKFSVISLTENEDYIELELFDQSGVETNSGDW
jgi:hypothetical protein